MYEDLANYVNNPEPNLVPEFQLVPNMLDSDLKDMLYWIESADPPKLLEVMVVEPFQTLEDTNLSTLTGPQQKTPPQSKKVTIDPKQPQCSQTIDKNYSKQDYQAEHPPTQPSSLRLPGLNSNSF